MAVAAYLHEVRLHNGDHPLAVRLLYRRPLGDDPAALLLHGRLLRSVPLDGRIQLALLYNLLRSHALRTWLKLCLTTWLADPFHAQQGIIGYQR